ncbi:MAG: PIN domain-containing protein [Sphingobacteriaceae bacterium]|nr:MAG: PIN domain-containing protein [Sphingobacteriaceae bacterium]
MKPMNDKVFLDSNILIYTYSATEPEKQLIARKLVIDNLTFISTQVLQELCNIVTRKFKFNYFDAVKVIQECSRNSFVHINSETTILQACSIAEKSGYSFYDCMIISAALESDCATLYSEDLHNGHLIDEKLTIKNPFV